MNYSPYLFRKYISYIISIFWLILFSCAVVESPPGGPEDTTSPEVLFVKPEAGSVNVPVDTEFEIRFSKTMNETTAEQAVFIQPLFFNYPEYKWSGKTLKVVPPADLRENTTYVLTVGAQARDNRANEIGKSKSFAFSTGDQIYEGSIYGEVLGKNMRNLNVWAYKLESADPDTFWKTLPDYVTQPDSLGNYRFDFLSYGIYLVVAIEDNNNDQFWAPPGERLALPDQIVYLTGEEREFGPLVMMTTERDTIQPYLSGAKSPDNQSVIIEFSQAVDSVLALNPINYLIFPPEKPDYPIIVKDVVPLSGDFKTFHLNAVDMIPEVKYRVVCRSIKSPFGIPADTISRMIQAGPLDTIKPEMIEIIPKPSRTPKPTGFDISITFSEPMDTSGFVNLIAFSDTSDTPIDFQYNWLFSNMISLSPEFEEDRTYYLTYDERLITDVAGNPLGDSLMEYAYVTASPDSFGQIIGQIANGPGEEIIVLAEPQRDGKIIWEQASPYGEFYIDRLLAGTYKLRAFFDRNNNGEFDGGMIRPFTFAEPIALYPDTVNVRARWETDIGVLDFRPQRIDVDTLQ